MRVRVLALAVALAAGGVACSVVDDSRVERISPQYGLEDTLPPTTTTIATTTTELATTTSGVDTTTTQPVQTEDVQLYFIANGKLVSVTKPLPSPVALPQLMAALQEGEPSGDLGTGLRTALPAVPALSVQTDATGLALVILPDGFFDTMAANDQRLAIGQIVVTLLTNLRGVGQVTFNQPVTKPSGELTAIGQPLTLADFETLLSTRSITTLTTIATTTSSAVASSTSGP